MGRDSSFLGNVCKSAVAIVAVKRVVQGSVKSGMTIGAHPILERTIGILVDFPNAVIDHEKIEPSVVVVVEPAGAHGPHFLPVHLRSRQARLASHIGKSSVAVVME